MKRLLLTLLFLPTLAYSADADTACRHNHMVHILSTAHMTSYSPHAFIAYAIAVANATHILDSASTSVAYTSEKNISTSIPVKPNIVSPHIPIIQEALMQGVEDAKRIWEIIQKSGLTVEEYFKTKFQKEEQEIVFKDCKIRPMRDKKPFPLEIYKDDYPEDVIFLSTNIVLEFLRKKLPELCRRLELKLPVKIYSRKNPDADCVILGKTFNVVLISESTLEKGPQYALAALLHELSHCVGDKDYLKTVDNALAVISKYSDKGEIRPFFSEVSVSAEIIADSRGALLGESEADCVLSSLIDDYRPHSAPHEKNPTHPSSTKRIRSASAIAFLLKQESRTPTPVKVFVSETMSKYVFKTVES